MFQWESLDAGLQQVDGIEVGQKLESIKISRLKKSTTSNLTIICQSVWMNLTPCCKMCDLASPDLVHVPLGEPRRGLQQVDGIELAKEPESIKISRLKKSTTSNLSQSFVNQRR
jgi:hypothetical protein